MIMSKVKLTLLEEEMHNKLCRQGMILWIYTKNQETRALNNLVEKGYAVFDNQSKIWKPLNV